MDAFSDQGKHAITSIQRYHKTIIAGKVICRYIELVDPNDKVYQTLFEYAYQVLDTLKVVKGFTHTEVMLNEHGPFLIELNPRLSGLYGWANLLATAAGYTSQGELYQQWLADYNNKHTALNATVYKKGRIICLQSWGHPFKVQNQA